MLPTAAAHPHRAARRSAECETPTSWGQAHRDRPGAGRSAPASYLSVCQTIRGLDGIKIVGLGRVSRVHKGQQSSKLGEHHRPGGVDSAAFVAESQALKPKKSLVVGNQGSKLPCILAGNHKPADCRYAGHIAAQAPLETGIVTAISPTNCALADNRSRLSTARPAA
jgi:hypothetical protein